jgi:hypothetical protein
MKIRKSRMPTFSCRGFETKKTSLQLGLSEVRIAIKIFRVGELICRGTETLISSNAFESHKTNEVLYVSQ